MRRIGYTSTGNILIELTRAEAQSLLHDEPISVVDIWFGPALDEAPVAPLVKDVIQRVGNDFLGSRIQRAVTFQFGDRPVAWLFAELRRIQTKQHDTGLTLAQLCTKWPTPPGIDAKRDKPLIIGGGNIGYRSIARLMSVFLDDTTDDAPLQEAVHVSTPTVP
jgi:hypothetical protein